METETAVRVSETDWARAAAFIDGEGCIYLGRTRPKSAMRNSAEYVPGIQVTNTNRVLIDWFLARFGGRSTTHRAGGNRKPRHDWRVTNSSAYKVLEGCRPHLLLKSKQADLLLDFRSLQGRIRDARGYVQPHTPEMLRRREEIRSRIARLNAKGSCVTVTHIDESENLA